MDNKLSELSNPVAYMTAEGVAITHLDFESGSWGMHNAANSDDMWSPLYSQEYVSALLARIAELEQKERHNERQNVIDGLAGAGESWSDIEEYMVKWDEERRNG